MHIIPQINKNIEGDFLKFLIGTISLGCSKNLVDTETMLGLLTQEGYALTQDVSLADILLVNTCGFIESA
ncbi:MAG: hypothetical protein H7Y41_00135, partial [Hyphomonadaceae bacterium]|nr:hypothetical protein [Clostridia bacterium]